MTSWNSPKYFKGKLKSKAERLFELMCVWHTEELLACKGGGGGAGVHEGVHKTKEKYSMKINSRTILQKKLVSTKQL